MRHNITMLNIITNKLVKIIYQKVGIAAMELGMNLDDYIEFLDSSGESELGNHFIEYQTTKNK